MSKNKTNKWTLIVSALCYGLCCLYALIHNIKIHDTYALMLVLVSVALPLIIFLVIHLLHIKVPITFYLVTLIFIFFASLVGSCLHGYAVPFYDKIVHFGSGLLASTIALIVFYHIRQSKTIKNKADYHLALVFINALNMSIALLWEYYEYAMLVFFNNDCIRHYATGIHDSMTDMLSATLAGLLFTRSFIHYHQTGKDHHLIKLANDIFILNHESDR